MSSGNTLQPISAGSARGEIESAEQARLNLDRAGLVEWFRIGDYAGVDATLDGLETLGIRRLRTALSWADFYTPDGPAWYDWLLPRIARRVELLPCVLYTPPSLGIEPKTSSPPRDPKALADFLDNAVDRYGACFDWIDLWNEPNNLNDWDWHLDPEWHQFSAMIGGAAYWMHRRGKRTLLGGMCPADVNWLKLMCDRGVVAHLDAVGVHAFPGTWQPHWKGWSVVLDRLREALGEHGLQPSLWITETGYSTWDYREIGQVANFAAALESDVERVYWYSYRDLPASSEGQEGFHFDERHYHTGLVTEIGRRKLLHRTLAAGGLDRLKTIARLARPPQVIRRPEYVLVTGGAGFVGANLADRLAGTGRDVLILDALARDPVEENVQWLVQRHGRKIAVEVGDVRDRHALADAVRGATQVFHLAAQVAVTCSIDDPASDFEINARGTFNVLEAIRARPSPCPLLFTSTNKVYGAACTLADLQETACRYEPCAQALMPGFGEDRPLDLHSPYGCSKGAGDQYVLDYARIFGIPAIVFRMSCIYGPRQFGNEDQGWVAHFLRAALSGQPITLYGTGKQVRDLLYVGDLVDALVLAQRHMPALQGRAFNIGGGPANTASLLEIIRLIGALLGEVPQTRFAEWRPGDQPWYVSDIRRFRAATGWQPRVGISEGVPRLLAWLSAWTGQALPGGALPESHTKEGTACASR